jgi:NlpC/P60 family
MKNLLFVAVALSVFTVTSTKTFAQPKSDFFKNYYAANFATSKIKALPVEIKVKAPVVTPKVLDVTEQCNTLQFKYAQILNREVELLTNIELYNFIDEWWAVRYRYGGTTKRGVDCSSYTGQLISATFGVTMPRTARAQYAATTRVRRDEMAEGDLVFFNTTGGISHVGIYLGDGYFTHSSCSRGVTISNLNEAYYSKKFIAGGRINPAVSTTTETIDVDNKYPKTIVEEEIEE